MSDDKDACSPEVVVNTPNVVMNESNTSDDLDEYYEPPCDNVLSSYMEYEEEESFLSDNFHDRKEANSVLSHLLSQVKIGMDLTKVTLPTFILERRSLLEMFAEFFAHANYFTDITYAETPLERILRVLKFYLSSFHAGRKGTMAKKPYNPILGEIFKCLFKIEGESTSDLSAGPIPWCNFNDVSFISEQVSHHPPISCVYAESEKHRVCFNCHLWTKSKFLGLSIGVNNIGYGTVYLLDHNEEYVCTFPSAYARNILGQPWFEMGGNCFINCPQTGLKCQVEFVTKPFFGGRKHTIKGSIFDVNSGITHYTISGQWNGVMTAESKNGEKIVLVDTKSDDIHRKYVRKIPDQEPNESRVIWKHVSTSLKNGDIKDATKYKTEIEDKQRKLVLTRQEKNEQWIPKLFKEEGEGWIYNNMLYKRIDYKCIWNK